MTAYLSIDIGTTHSKVALFGEDGTLIRLALCPTVTNRSGEQVTYNPEQLWNDVAALIRNVTQTAEGIPIRGIGITSMAESGLLISKRSGRPKSPFIPWFSTVAMQQIERIATESDPVERFIVSGVKPSYKFGLPKLMWIREQMPEAFLEDDPIWLSAADYIAYRLTGAFATDFTLAARTYAYRIDLKTWDAEWLESFGFSASMFPEVHPAGDPVGQVLTDPAQALGIPGGIPVVIAGHDHVAAALAAGVVKPGATMDSIGTAETLVGMLPERTLTREDYETGFSYGLHLVKNAMFWMGGVSASGGSVEWFRSLLSDKALSYEQISQLLSSQEPTPTGIIYIPNMTGSGALIGLKATYGKGHILKAVLEGTAYEMEMIRETAERVAGYSLNNISVVGGGAKNKHWLQIKADVSGTELQIPEQHESALLGAAMMAAVGAGTFESAVQAQAGMSKAELPLTIIPQWENHKSYKRLYGEKYKPLQAAIRKLTP